MFRPTQALFKKYRKVRLTTKDVNKGFYKGTRTGRMGTHDKWGGFRIDWNLVRTYVCPDLEGFKLTPFVTMNVRATSGMQNYTQYADSGGPRSPYLYLDKWKVENAKD